MDRYIDDEMTGVSDKEEDDGLGITSPPFVHHATEDHGSDEQEDNQHARRSEYPLQHVRDNSSNRGLSPIFVPLSALTTTNNEDSAAPSCSLRSPSTSVPAPGIEEDDSSAVPSCSTRFTLTPLSGTFPELHGASATSPRLHHSGITPNLISALLAVPAPEDNGGPSTPTRPDYSPVIPGPPSTPPSNSWSTCIVATQTTTPASAASASVPTTPVSNYKTSPGSVVDDSPKPTPPSIRRKRQPTLASYFNTGRPKTKAPILAPVRVVSAPPASPTPQQKEERAAYAKAKAQYTDVEVETLDITESIEVADLVNIRGKPPKAVWKAPENIVPTTRANPSVRPSGRARAATVASEQSVVHSPPRKAPAPKKVLAPGQKWMRKTKVADKLYQESVKRASQDIIRKKETRGFGCRDDLMDIILIETPRTSAAVPNEDGTYAIFTVSTYSIAAQTETKEVKIIDLQTTNITLFSDNGIVESPQWLIGTHVFWKVSLDGGGSQLWVRNFEDGSGAYLLGVIDAPVFNVKTKALGNGTIALAFSAPFNAEGKLFNPKSLPKPRSTAREYETVKVRHWDKYWEGRRSTLWYTIITEEPKLSRYKLNEAPPINAFKDTKIEFPWSDSPLSGASTYDLSQCGLLVSVIDTGFDPAKSMVSEVYHIPLTSFTEEKPFVYPLSALLKDKFTGSATGGVFSPNGEKIVFLKQKNWRQPSDHPFIFLFNLKSPKSGPRILNLGWDRIPTSFIWSLNSESLFATANDLGKNRLFALAPFSTKEILTTGSIDSVYLLPFKDRGDPFFFINTTSFVDPRQLHLYRDGEDKTIFSTTAESSLGLHTTQVSQFWYTGGGDYNCQCFVVRPSTFQEGKKYPAALWIHGGPQSEWNDSWSYRWSAAAMAEQGYIVMMPNPTGSTGFGQDFSRDVEGSWGGRPYQDLVKCWGYVEQKLEYADTLNAVALGASYGGYMINWIAGQPLAKKFKTLVCHDGIFSNLNLMSSDFPALVPPDMAGPIYDPKALPIWDKYSPARYTENWTQPMLIIHSDNDFRCPITEGLAAFNVCQTKGIPSRFLNFPDENHFVLRRKNSLHWHKTVLGWCNKYARITDGIKLQPPVTEPWNKDDKSDLYSLQKF